MSDAFNEELHDLADAGCPIIQMEEPQIHLLAARKIIDKVINPEFMLKVFNNTVRGLRAKTEVWCHTCWGNPSPAAHVRRGADLQAGAGAAEPGGRRRARSRWQFSAMGPRRRGQGDHREESRHRRHRSPHPPSGVDGPGGRHGAPCPEAHPGRAVDVFVRLRHGPRGHEPPPRILQDGRARPGCERREKKSWACRSPSRWPRIRRSR